MTDVGVLVEAEGRAAVLEGAEAFVIGRDPTTDFRIDHSRISRHHLKISAEGSSWRVTDLSSSNGTYIDDAPISEVVLSGELLLRLGGSSGIELRVRELSPPSSQPTQAVEQSADDADLTTFIRRASQDDVTETVTAVLSRPAHNRVVLSSRVRIGRADENDWVLDDPLLSRFHAEVIRTQDDNYEIVDLTSANGTFVNGLRVRRSRLDPGDNVTVGGTSVRFTGTALEPVHLEGGYYLSGEGICVDINGRRLLDSVSFSVAPRSLTAIVGPSGAGKSTLLGALTGQRPISHGTVRFAGLDLLANYDELRNRIGLVPQADLLHSNLTTRQALTFGASLRFPKDSTRAERDARVNEVLHQIGLTERADLRIDRLSGGQRKRASVALELLTQPSLLLLDEPTSGLDPGLDRQIMNLLRELADGGRTVMVVTHAVANIDVCDNVILLAEGGHLAYFGPPDGVFRYFGASDWDEVFEKLAAGDYRKLESPARPNQTQGTTVLPPLRRQSRIFQMSVLTKRSARVILSDRPYALFLLTLPIFVGIVGFISGSSSGLGTGPDAVLGLNPDARIIILILALGAVFVGASASIQELVKERQIYERERSIGLSSTAYLASKLIVLGVIVIGQAIVFASVTMVGRPGPTDPLVFSNGKVEIAVVVAFLTFVSMVIGLLISSRIKTTDVALPILVVLTMVAIVLSGAIPLRFPDLLSVVGWLDPAYWAVSAMGATTGLNSLVGLAPEDQIVRWSQGADGWWQDMFALAMMMSVAVVAVVLSDRARRR